MRAFSARRMAVLEPVIRGAHRRPHRCVCGLGRSRYRSASLTFPLPAITIFTMIGFPDDDLDQLKAWCGDRLSMTWGPARAGRPGARRGIRWSRIGIIAEAFVERPRRRAGG